MNLQHLNVKVFAAQPEAIRFQDFIAIFNDWIQRKVGDEMLIDVADYSHVFAGPGVLLIAHEANYSLDNEGNRPGLLYNRKALVEGSNQAKLEQATLAALAACRRLEEEKGFRFNGGEVQVIVNDRLIAPNTPETLAALKPEIETFFDRLYGKGAYSLATRPDPRERFTVDVKATAEPDVASLLRRLSEKAVEANV